MKLKASGGKIDDFGTEDEEQDRNFEDSLIDVDEVK
jgi:hypothetical protein